jgi:hypothetical protein
MTLMAKRKFTEVYTLSYFERSSKAKAAFRKDYACYTEFYWPKFLGATCTAHQAPPPLKNVLSYVRPVQHWPRFLSDDNGAEDTDNPKNL